MFTRPADRRAAHARHAGARQGRALRPPPQPRAQAPGGVRRAAGGVPGGGDRDAGRRSGARADHHRRQPGAEHAERRAARRGAGVRSSSWSASTSTSTRRRRHADVILPGLSPLEQSHYDVALRQLAIRNVATYSAPVFDAAGRAAAGVADAAAPRRHRHRAGRGRRRRRARRLRRCDSASSTSVGAPASPIHGRDPTRSSPRWRRGAARSACSISCCARDRTATASAHSPTASRSTRLEAQPHGIDFGPLEPRIPEVLRTPSGKIELAPAALVADVERLRAAPGAATATAWC